MPGGVRHPRLGSLFLALGSLIFTGLLLGSVEILLRIAGVGQPDPSRASLLRYQQVYLPLLARHEEAGGRFVLRTLDQRVPYQTILEVKPPDAFRVFTFGGSATAGLGFGPNATFARYLERMLERSYPGRTIEVMNLGIVALASRQVKLLVEEVVRHYDPDLVVVYSGNNEFLELHARKYAETRSSAFDRLRNRLVDTNVYRSIDRAVRGPPVPLSPTQQHHDAEGLRRTQDAIIREISMAPGEIESVVDEYAANLRQAVDVCLESGTTIILATVASNWEWRGREDLAENWMEELLGGTVAVGRERYERALEILDDQLLLDAPRTRWEVLFRRAVVREALGDFDGARADYRAAMNQDPHLRRALDAMAERVRELEKDGAIVADVVEALMEASEHRIVGFDAFYDYVHFTPKGAVLTAAEVFRTIQRAGALLPARPGEAEAFAAAALDALDSLERDPYALEEWIGFGFDPSRIHDRDLWKYDRLLEELDNRLQEEPGDVSARVYRANASYFRLGAAQEAERHYREALKSAGEHTVIRANLNRLLSQRRH